MNTSRHGRHYLREYNLKVVLSKIGRKRKLKIFLKPIDLLYNIIYNISTKKEKRGKRNEQNYGIRKNG